MEYYVEYIFLQEFIIDFMIVYLTGKLLGMKNKANKIVASAALGAIYTVISYAIPMEFTRFFIAKFAYSLLILTIAFNPNGFFAYIRCTAVFYLISFLSAKIVELIYVRIDSKIGIIYIFLGIIASFIIVKLTVFGVKEKKIDINCYRYIDIYLNEKVVRLKGYIDTGNQLVDPISKLPVIVTDLDSLKILFQEKVFQEIKVACKGGDNEILNFMLLRMQDFRFRLLRYGTVSGDNEYMLGFLPTRVCIKQEKFSYEVSCVIGVRNNKVSIDNRFEALLFDKILEMEGEMEYEKIIK